MAKHRALSSMGITIHFHSVYINKAFSQTPCFRWCYCAYDNNTYSLSKYNIIILKLNNRLNTYIMRVHVQIIYDYICQRGRFVFMGNTMKWYKDFGTRGMYLGHAYIITSHCKLRHVITYLWPWYLLLAPKTNIPQEWCTRFAHCCLCGV